MRALALALLLGLGATAQAAATYEDTVEPYVVKSGDTISDITYDFLGDSLFWEDNWKLNPQVQDPDKLRIGQVLQIIVKRKVIAESAQLVEAINQTEKMLTRPSWQPAATGDTLVSGQGLRTGRNSTAELRFNTESSLRLGEYSQLFLSRKDTSLRGLDRGSVTVEQGAVDIVFAPLAKSRTQIEVNAGPSTLRPVAQAGKPAEIRAGTTADGGAKVMVFAGASQVDAGGNRVEVPRGMGTRVPESGPPRTPEKLLPAPTLTRPALRWNYSNGRLQWAPVAGAAGYTVEICADAACTQPRQREKLPADATRLQVQPLPAGRSYWRVSAVAASDLDGYPSVAGSIEVEQAVADLHGPMLALRPVAGAVQTADGAQRLGPQTKLSMIGHDERAGLDRIEIEDAHGDWQVWGGEPLAVDDYADRPLRLRAYDRLDNRSELEVLTVDAARP